MSNKISKLMSLFYLSIGGTVIVSLLQLNILALVMFLTMIVFGLMALAEEMKLQKRFFTYHRNIAPIIFLGFISIEELDNVKPNKRGAFREGDGWKLPFTYGYHTRAHEKYGHRIHYIAEGEHHVRGRVNANGVSEYVEYTFQVECGKAYQLTCYPVLKTFELTEVPYMRGMRHNLANAQRHQ